MSEKNEQKAWVVMSQSGESWGPVAVCLDEAEARRVVATLNTRLFGGPRLHDSGNWTYTGFSVAAVGLNPSIEDTGAKQYHLIDPDDPEWHPVIDPEMIDGAPEDVWAVATMIERGAMTSLNEYELREPEVTS